MNEEEIQLATYRKYRKLHDRSKELSEFLKTSNDINTVLPFIEDLDDEDLREMLGYVHIKIIDKILKLTESKNRRERKPIRVNAAFESLRKIQNDIKPKKRKIIDPSYIDPSYIDPSYIDPSYIDPSYIDPSYIDPSYIDPSYTDPSYTDPSYTDPSYIDPSYIDPSYIDPSYIEPFFYPDFMDKETTVETSTASEPKEDEDIDKFLTDLSVFGDYGDTDYKL
jgi:hypothetical protein